MEDSEYVLHIEFQDIQKELDELQKVDKVLAGEISDFLLGLKKAATRIEPTLRSVTNDERELWEEYKQLQREKLAVLDLSHEWDYLDQNVKNSNPQLDILIKDAIEELNDHISVLAESHRAYIDILEIYNTRKIEVLALVVTGVISYLAVWEFFVRDLLANIVFPNGLSPALNYVTVIITLLPIFVTVIWAWVKRKVYF